MGQLLLTGNGTVNLSNTEGVVTQSTFTQPVSTTLKGSSDFDVTGVFNWSGGTQTGTGETNALGGLNITGSAIKDLQRTLNNSAVATYNATGALVFIGTAAVFHNMAVSRAALPLLRAAPQGRIINIASTAALEGAAYIAAYAASKHALLGLSRSLAAELIDVKVHTVLPGYVDSPLTDRTVARIVEATGKSEEETRAFLGSQNESGKLITPAQVADAVVQLLAEDETGREVVLQ